MLRNWKYNYYYVDIEKSYFLTLLLHSDILFCCFLFFKMSNGIELQFGPLKTHIEAALLFPVCSQ